jgi:hypothetical protein
MGCGRLVVPDGHGPDRPAVDDHRAVVRREAAPDGRGRPWRDARAMLNGGAVGVRTGARVRPTMRGDKRVFAAGSTHPRWYMESPLRHSIPRRVEVSAGTGGPAEAGRVRVHAGARSGRRPLRVVADEVVGCRRGPAWQRRTGAIAACIALPRNSVPAGSRFASKEVRRLRVLPGSSFPRLLECALLLDGFARTLAC